MGQAAEIAGQNSIVPATAVLIPARRHEPQLTPLVEALLEAGFGAVVLVDDGSPAEERGRFEALAARPRVHLLRHAVNLGKGRALKTGINYFLTALPAMRGLVTADADGQHAVEDIVRVACALDEAGGRPVLGCRGFDRDVPLRSRFGNGLTRQVFHFLSGQRVTDTQTGLRGFPRTLLPALLALPGERYEYEMTVLAYLCRHGKAPVEVRIATIYIDGNRSSRFNPVLDSMRIYFVLLRFYASALVSAGLDLLGFTLVFALSGSVLAGIAVGRLSSLANFLLNRRFVFHSGVRVPVALGRYYLLAVVVAAASYFSIMALSRGWGWNVFVVKLVVETLLSLATFSIQRIFVFPQVEAA